MGDTLDYTHAAFFPDEASARQAAERFVAEMQATSTRVREEAGDDLKDRFSLYVERQTTVSALDADHDQAGDLVDECGGWYDGGFTAPPWPSA